MGNLDNQFTISHEFDAVVEKVFAAWTEVEQLKHWFAPKGYSIVYTKADIRPGGESHYCMESTGGIKMWGRAFYKEIKAPLKIVYTQCFSNEKGGIERHPMNDTWPLEMLTTVMLDEKDGKTILNLTWKPVNASREEITTFSDGVFEMNQNWGGTFDRLEAYLAGGA